MTDDSTVNSQITDSTTQANATVVGQAPAQTLALLDAVLAETVGMAMHNAVTAQHNAQMVNNAAVTSTCAKMLQVPSFTVAPAPPEPPTPVSPLAGSGDVSPMSAADLKATREALASLSRDAVDADQAAEDA